MQVLLFYRNLQHRVLKSHSKRFFHRSNLASSGFLSDPENKGSRQRGVNFETLGSWNNRIDTPILVEQSIKKGKLIPAVPLEEVGHTSLISRRNLNEDRIIISELTKDISMFAVFDGHGSPIAADFVTNLLEPYLKTQLRTSNNLSDVLRDTFLHLHNLLARQLFFRFMGTECWSYTGTTATVCLLCNGDELTIGHVGDTRAILCRNGKAIRLTTDHHADVEEEKQRIAKFGGTIISNSVGVAQVDGRLGMTRSIGDVSVKHLGVTPDPFISSMELKHGKDACLILVSDGVTFVLSDQEMADIVISCANPSEAANFITDQALQYGSEDNATAIIVPLGAWGKYRRQTQAIPYSFRRTLIGAVGKY